MRLRSLSPVVMSLAALAFGCGGSGGASNATDDDGGTDATVPGQGDSGGGDDTGVTTPLGDDGSNGDDSSTTPAVGISVLQFHNHANRDGQFVDPKLTASGDGGTIAMTLDTTFKPTFDGNVYAQPLYVQNGPSGKAILITVTENNNVYAVDETGKQVWMTNVGAPASGAEGCGNIQPLGITGTPVVDLTHRAVYLDAARPGEAASTMAEHEIHALSIDTGIEVSGWPVHASSLSYNGTQFNPRPQNERGALLVFNDTLYVPYGGHAGDCADSEGHFYKGWVVGVPLDSPQTASAWATESDEGGIWSVGGMATDGTSVFASTGNAGGGQTCPVGTPTSPPPGWKQQEALIRFQPGPVWSGQTTDYFAPIDWGCLDNGDKDLGGSSPVLVDLPSGSNPHLVVGLGKDGKMYLVDRTNLGGVGTDVATATIMSGEIKMAPITYTNATGTYVVSYGSGGATGTMCPTGQSGTLVAMKIVPGSPPTIAPGWCTNAGGEGSPIFTTSDAAGDDPLVWNIGAESNNLLQAWNANTGAVAFAGGGSANAVTGFHHFSTILVANGRIFAGADNTMYAFKVAQ